MQKLLMPSADEASRAAGPVENGSSFVQKTLTPSAFTPAVRTRAGVVHRRQPNPEQTLQFGLWLRRSGSHPAGARAHARGGCHGEGTAGDAGPGPLRTTPQPALLPQCAG